jgi:SAM-dependent methyltransferase
MPIVYGEFLTMNEFEPASFDCITMWAVLEHIYEPMEYVKRVSTLLKADGRFIFLVTNFNSIQGRCYEMDDYPRHLNLFTKRAVRYLLDQSGLELVRVSTDQSIFGGHLQGGLIYCAKRLFGYSREDALTEWKSDVSLQPFFHLWRGNPSAPLRLLARIDRLLLSPAEWLLDRLGFGFTLTVEARKAPALNEFTTKEG